MANRIYVKPRPRNPDNPKAGAIQVRRENGKVIPAPGTHVELTPYIRRRLRDGDLVKATPPKKAKSTANAASAGDTKE